jgi:hypothetical protein
VRIQRELLSGGRLTGLALIACVTLAARPHLVVPVRSPGLMYTLTSVQEHTTPAGAVRADTSVAAIRWSGDNGRTDVRRMSTSLAQRGDSLARAFGGAPGQYVLIKRGRAAVIVVDTVRREYFERNIDSAMKSMMGNGPRPQVHAIDSGSVVRIQPDSVIDGRVVQHWHSARPFTLAMLSMQTAMHITEDIYVDVGAQDLRFDYSGDDGDALPGLGEVRRYFREAFAKAPHGLHVLVVMRTDIDLGSVHITSTATTRMSDIQYTDIPGEAFEVPDGYQRVPPPEIPLIPGAKRPK